jgi:hypothetical protein
MRFRTVVTVLFMGAVASVGAQGLSKPCETPFECATRVRVSNATASWKLSFDRHYGGIYDIVHWGIVYSTGRHAEYLAQLMRPRGKEMYYRFFIRERRGVWYTLGIRKRSVWREVRRPSAEQNAMAGRLQLLLGNAQALRDGADPALLAF